MSELAACMQETVSPRRREHRALFISAPSTHDYGILNGGPFEYAVRARRPDEKRRMKLAASPAAPLRPAIRTRAILLAAALVCIANPFLLGGCATPAQAENMVPLSRDIPQAAADSPLRGAIAVDAVGGGEAPASNMAYSTVGNAELEKALRRSLHEYGYLSTDDAGAPFRLKAFLMELRRPRGGFTMVATSFVRYKVSRGSDGRIVYDDIVDVSASKTFDDEFVGAIRDRMVLEASIRENIAEFLRALNSLDVARSGAR
jgi:hypothetical protein